MSHVVTLKHQFKDLNAMKKAAERLGGQLVEGATHYKWWGYSVGDYPIPEGFTEADLGKCHHKIMFPGVDYEVGIVDLTLLPEGHPAREVYKGHRYIPIYDFVSAGISQKMDGWDQKEYHKYAQVKGKGYAFTQAYVLEKAKLEARKKGFSTKEVQEKDGSITLKINTGG